MVWLSRLPLLLGPPELPLVVPSPQPNVSFHRSSALGLLPNRSNSLCSRTERRRYLLRRALLWSFGPILLTIGMFILALVQVAGRRIFPNALPFLSLVVVWLAGYFVIRMREQRGLQREIDALNDLDRTPFK